MIFSAYKYTCILCVVADSYVDANTEIKFRDFMSFVCTSSWNGCQASAKLNKGKPSFSLELVPVSKWE